MPARPHVGLRCDLFRPVQGRCHRCRGRAAIGGGAAALVGGCDRAKLTFAVSHPERIMTPASFKRIALGLPGAIEGRHMGHADFRVNGKVFATLGWPDSTFGMVKLP